MNAAYLRIGMIVRAHGVRGAVKVVPTTDDPARFSGLTDAFLELRDGYRPVRIRSASVRPDSVLLSLEGVDTCEDAEKLRNVFLAVDRAHAVSLPENTYYVADLVGCRVSDTNGRALGTVTDVLETGANDVYEIDHGKLLVPALKRVLAEVDTAQGRIVFDAAALGEVGLFED